MLKEDGHFLQLELRIISDAHLLLSYLGLLHLSLGSPGQELTCAHRKRTSDGFGDPGDHNRLCASGAPGNPAHDSEGDEESIHRTKHELSDATALLDPAPLSEDLLLFRRADPVSVWLVLHTDMFSQTARWGGEEFALLMSGAGAEAAHRQAESIYSSG
jgi:hypothetical protein